MKRVDVAEFRDHFDKYLAADEATAIEQDGKPVGFYIPTALEARQGSVPVDKNGEAATQAMKRLEETVQRVLEETGLTEEELADFFDLSKPAPDLPKRLRSGRAAPRAPGR